MSYKLPTRFDNDYTTIEKFEKYEYTHCFTYKLARRNTQVKSSLNFLYELFIYYNQIMFDGSITTLKDRINLISKMDLIVIHGYLRVELEKCFKQKTDYILKDLPIQYIIIVMIVLKSCNFIPLNNSFRSTKQ
jgi:hypothetical protein